jgi:beta-galactosidase
MKKVGFNDNWKYGQAWRYGGGGIKVSTVKCSGKAKTATLDISLDTVSDGKVNLTLSTINGKVVATKETDERKLTWDLEGITLWSKKNPYLYDLTAKIGDDEVTETIGIRILKWGPKNGIEINGRRVILRGVCVHQDNNSILGASSFYEAEERKVRLLMEKGYNAIRCVHNPCSKELLKACDRLGMLVMDECVDEDLYGMVKKDYNHPSVIMYSIGNKVADIGYLHSLDATRPVCCEVNKTAEGESYNKFSGMIGDYTRKISAMLNKRAIKNQDAYADIDIAGYNYGIIRYKQDLKKYPNRLILGSKTFCKDAYNFYELAKKEPRIVGDFVWTGKDYIGDIGYADGEALYTRVAFARERGPYIAVKPVCQDGKPATSAWKMTDAKESWSWEDCTGMTAQVEVYARAYSVELFVNGKSEGKHVLRNKCNTTYKVTYDPGMIEAVAYDRAGNELGRKELLTASGTTQLILTPEKDSVSNGGLIYIRMEYTDKMGIWKPMEKHKVLVEAENGELKGLVNACPYNKDGYWQNHTSTYYGRALAVVKAGVRGEVTVKVMDESDIYTVTVPIKA